MAFEEHDVEQFNITTSKVIEFLCKKAQYEGAPQMENNKTFLGTIGFWFTGKKLKDGTFIDMHLAFDSSPSVWDFKRISDEIEMKEHEILISQGVNISF